MVSRLFRVSTCYLYRFVYNASLYEVGNDRYLLSEFAESFLDIVSPNAIVSGVREEAGA